MIFEGFKLHAVPTIREAYCRNKKCKTKPELVEVSNGLLSVALFCSNCHSVYALKLERIQKVSKEYLRQCLDQIELETIKNTAGGDYLDALEARKEVERNIRLTKKITKKKK